MHECKCDGYNTFWELYNHRNMLFIALCYVLEREMRMNNYANAADFKPWKTRNHSDNSHYDGYFLLGIGKRNGMQITFHIPNKFWKKCHTIETLSKAPEYDGHTSDDIIERLKNL